MLQISSTDTVQRASSQRKFKILSFFEKLKPSYPLPSLPKHNEDSSFGKHLDSEMHFSKIGTHEFLPLEETDLKTEISEIINYFIQVTTSIELTAHNKKFILNSITKFM